MKKRILSILLLCCMVLTLLPTAAFAAGEIDEQFTLAPGGTYYFDLSAMGIPGTVNDALPDKTMRYIPFTYAGTVDAYKLTSAMAATDEYAETNKYAHSLFVADYTVTHEVSWDELNAGRLIFGRDYAAGGVDYILRAPSVGSGRIGSAESQRGTPPSNEWDRILDKNDGYIKNWFGMYSWGQDTLSTSASDRAARGYFPPGGWSSAPASHQDAVAGFRPVLEVLNPGSLGSDGLKAVTLDLGGGKLGDESSIQIIVETGSVFTAPASDGLTRPDGNTGNYFMWRDNDGQLYAPGDYVPADVTKLTAQFNLPEQFTLAPGGTYYFDLSAMGIPGTVNDALPDKTMGYVPFTYAGTVDSYKLTSEMATTEEDAEQNQYPHSLFVADYAVTHTISWDDLNTANLIFVKNYASGGVDYTLRAPSVGSNATGLGDSDPGEPQSNEWDTMLNKDSGYIQNWNEMYSWGQDTVSFDASFRAVRGYYSARYWHYINASRSYPDVGFRPVLEVLNPGTMGSDRLKAVTLDLGGGKLGGSSEAIQIVVKNGESFAAPASEGLTRPDGNTGSYFEWLGSDGELYAPDDNVPADVTKLTAQFVPPEQFNLAPGGVYYFDLSGVGIPDTVNDALPDNTLHYVPFTYAGTVDAYKLTSEMATTEEYAETYKYAHSLFVADYAVTYAASWDHLNAIDMIFGKDYTAGGVDYTMRAPSEGSDYTGSGDSERGTPQSNEWDRLLDKDDGYIKNWNGIFSCGQDTVIRLPWRRTVRGHYSSRFCGHRDAAGQNPQVGFRPVLEVLNRDTIGPDGLKTVTLDLGGGKLGDESSIRIIVKNGSEFTAPASDGLTRPEGATGNYFKWLGSDGKLYAPGASVPEDVTTLTARFVPDTYTVIVTTDSLPDGKTGKAYSHTLTAISTAPITWSIDEGALPAGLRLNEKTGEISGIPTAAGTATFTVKAENSEGSDTRALSIIISNPVEQTPVRYLDADGKERFCTEYTVLKSVIIEDFFNSDSKWYDMPAGWYVVEGDVTITPRLDTHGAVNLILTDDCHLTVPWGINVKEGDTFTIYAQSTAEASMGKLTACLPEWSDHDKSVWPVAGLSGIGAGVRVWAANDNFYENEGTIIINGGNIRARGQYGSSAIGGSHQDRNVSSDGDTPGNLRQGGSITINGGIVCTELRTSGGAHTADSFGIGTCGGNGGSVTINGGTIIAEASSSAISSGRGGSITINGGNVTAHGGINRYENQPQYAIPGNGIGSLEGGSITINGGTVKASSDGDGFGIGGAGVHHTAEMHITINGGNIETTANRNNAAIGDKSKHKSSVTITGGVIHAVGKGSAAGIGSTGDIRITGGEISAFAEGGGAAIGSIGGVDCKSITINGNAIKSLSSKDGACIGAATGGSVGSITISDTELPLLSSNKILIGWDADSPGGKLTIRNCRVASTDTLSVLTDGIRVGSNSELVIEESEIRLPHLRGIRVGGNGSIAVRDSDLHTYGIFMDETAQSSNDAKTLKKLEITNSTVLTGDIIGARGGYSSVDEVVIHGSSIRLNDEYTYNYCTIGGGTHGSFGSIDIQNSQIHIPSSGGNTAIGNGWQVYYNRESRIRIANSEVSVRCASLGPAIGAAWDSGSGRINIIIENSTVTAKGGNLRTDGNYVPGIGKNALGRAPEIGIQILNSTVDTFRLTEKGGTDYVYDDLHEKNLPGIPPENITICGSTVNRKTIDHSFDEYGKCAICGKYDLGYCYEHGLLTMDGLTDCASDGSEKKLTGLSHKTGENETKQLAENTDYTASYSNNVAPYTLTPEDEGFEPAKAPKVTLYGMGNYCGKAEHYFTISTEAPAAEHTVTVRTDGNGTASASHAKAAAGTEITLTATPNEGYHFKEWEVMSGGVTIKDDKFTMPSANVEVKAIFKDMSKEQFTLAPGGTYYFDLSAMGIPGTVNDALPDKTMRYVPFTYAGTVDAYKLMSEMATTEEYAEQNKYDHSLFVADFAVTHAVSWDNLNAEGLIFGKGYATGSVDYTLRAPSGGSGGTGSGALERGTPQSNEWDRILDKDDGYIKNWRNIGSWGQDTLLNTLSNRVFRGRYDLPRNYAGANTTLSFPFLGFRPVLEVLNPGTLGYDGLKAVTLDLGGGKLGGSSDTIQIIVKTGESFTAPASEGLTRPDGNTGSYFEWLGSDGELYAPDDNVPADVTKLTAQFALSEQFSLTPGGTYYFDLSGASIPGTANSNLPDTTLHYVPFTYAGTIEAYKLTSATATTEEYAQQNKYAHSLFVADYAVTHTVSWNDLDTASLIFGKDYVGGGVDYTLRAPSVGSNSTGSGDSQRGVPQSNEWDTMLNKNSGYIKNWNGIYSWGQDTTRYNSSIRAVRGHDSARYWRSYYASYFLSFVGFRPVLEVLNPDELGADALKAVTLDLGGGKLGGSTDAIQIIVKNGSTFTAPMSGGLTRPDGNTGSYFMWLGSNGKLYAPGASVPADVTKLTAQFALSEQFSLTPGGTYYFDLSSANIPGTANGSLPDSTLHYVPFTYAGTIEAYKLTSAMATTEEYAQQNKYPHSLFVADYAVTHTVSWNGLNDEGLIFGKNYASGGVDYTLRAPSVGSNATGSGDSQRGVPQSNEWDTMLNKNSGYIKNWNGIYSWGQDTTRYNSSFRAVRGFISARLWGIDNAASSDPNVVFRPVLEILNPDTLGSDGLKVVTLDLGGGTLGNSSEDIQIIVKTGSEFTAPASDGMTRPNGDTGSYFMWLGSDGKLYAPGASVPADVTKLTAQFALSEQFSLTPGGTYYFDLSAMGIPGTVNDALPDNTLHYVPFTYAGTADAYKLMSEMATTEEYAQQKKYPHSLFIADYNVTFNVDWNQLNEKQMIFGTPYTSYGVNYTMRAPSAGSQSNNGKDDSSTRGIPKSNEWDAILDKANQDWKDNISGYIKNWSGKYSFGQDNYAASYRAYRGYFSARFWGWSLASTRHPDLGFRPVLEVLNPDTLDSDGLKVVTLDLGGGKLGGSSDAIHIIVKTGSKFTAPASDGMTRPDGNTGSFFMWLGSDGKLYAPGAIVPAEVTKLTVQWTAPTYAVTLNTNGGTIADGKDVTGYTYGVGATLPTDVTRTGYTFKGWYDNEGLTGDPVTAIGNTETGNKEYWAKWEINQYTITVKPENGKADITITQDYGTPITAPTLTREGYQFNGWDKTFPTTMPAENLTITAQWTVNQYTITYDLAGGTAEGNLDTYTIETGAFTLKNPTKSGYTFTGWSGTGLDGEDNLTVTIQKGSTGNRSYTAHWRYNGGGSSGYSYYTIKATAGTGGSISPSGNVSVREGRDQTFTITPDKGYAVANVKIDGKSIGAVKSYTFENVRRTHTIEVIFMKANGNPQTGVFVDVATGSYYEDAVDWAVENGITKGTDDTHFSPDGICTRAQAVTFLWRAAGSPKPETRTMPFTDVPAGSYYYDAVLWAVENGITKGTSDTRFSPDDTCTRAQIVAFLWRSEKSPAAGSRNPFADVKSTAYYADAVLWAVREDITKGTTSTTFSPDADCTRAQIVTFLWRCKK